jgi:hypothetical protein
MQKKGIFQAGLSLSCPNCELEFWVHLDDVATETRCELCAKVFLITPQLRDRDWRYRRSGLFGKNNNQEGSIPVAVTLQQLDTSLNPNSVFLAAMTLAPTTAPIGACETDLVVLQQEFFSGKISLAIGESKTRVEISDDDVRNLTKVADVMQSDRIDAFIVFSKLDLFTQDEIERCRKAQLKYRYRVIMLSSRELEPYFVYERTAKEFAIRSTANTLQDLADATNDVYFDPKPKH